MTIPAEPMSETPSPRRLTFHLLVLALAGAVAAALLVNIILHPAKYQWDFKVYYHAVEALSRGQDPYQVENTRRFWDDPNSMHAQLPFLYPPLTLHFFQVFTNLPLLVSAELWLALKLFCLGILLTLWSRTFLPLRLNVFLLVFLMLAFNKTLYNDLSAGNVSIFEETLLWGGFACLLAGRRGWFGLCIVLAAQFKLSPVLFLLLLLVADSRPHWKTFLSSAAAFAAIFSLNAVLHPALLRRFWEVAPRVDHRGGIDPATLSFTRDVVDHLTARGLHTPLWLSPFLYLCVIVPVLIVSARAWRTARASGRLSLRLAVLFFCVTYAICMPRFANYTYIMLLIPALYIVRCRPSILSVPLLAVLLLLPGEGDSASFDEVISFAYSYSSLLIAYLLWYLYLRELHEERTQRVSDVPEGEKRDLIGVPT